MELEELIKEWTAHYLGGMGFRLYQVVPQGEGGQVVLGWRGKEAVRFFYRPMEEGREGLLEVEYRPGSLPRGVEEGLFKVLGVLVPPGGRIALEADLRELEEYLRRGVPLALTPWGLLVWLAGGRGLVWTEDGVVGRKTLRDSMDLQEWEEWKRFVENHRESGDPYVQKALEKWETIEWELEG